MDLPEKKYTQQASGDGIRSKLPLVLDTTTSHFQFRDNTAPSACLEYIFNGARAPCDPAPPHYQDFTVTLRHTTGSWTQTPLPDTQHSQVTDIHAPGGIRTGKLSKGAVTDRTATRIEVFAYAHSKHLHTVHCYL
jgi:hypothetical protein